MNLLNRIFSIINVFHIDDFVLMYCCALQSPLSSMTIQGYRVNTGKPARLIA